MSYAELYETVKTKITSRQAITTIYIQMRYHTLQSDARRCVAQLQDEGLIGREWDPSLGGYPVIKREVKTL